MPPIYGFMSGSVGGQSALAVLAASMSTGQTRTFTMGGLNYDLLELTGGAGTPNMLGADVARMKWDPTHKKIHYANATHTVDPEFDAARYIRWDDATNQWEVVDQYSTWGQNYAHDYYHMAIKPDGTMYRRMYNSAQVRRHLYGATGDAGWTTGNVENIPNGTVQVAGALDWFPALNSGNGGLVFFDVFGFRYSNAALDSWTDLNEGTAIAGQIYNAIAVTSQYCHAGGGNGGDLRHWKLSPGGTVSACEDFPTPTGVNRDRGILVPHPNGDDLLVFEDSASGADVYRYNLATDDWTQLADINSIDDTEVTQGGSVGEGPWPVYVTIPEYEIVLMVASADFGNPTFAWVYKPA